MEPLLLSAPEISKITGMSTSYAYKVIRQLNTELSEKGFLTFPGKTNKKYFYERVYGGEARGEK